MVVVDTNVLYSGLRSQFGASYVLLDALSDGRVEFAVSAALVFEYEDVLKRQKSNLVYDEYEIDEILDSLIGLGHRCSPHFLWRPFLKDAKDDMVLELAVVSGADQIITYNLKDFTGISEFGIKAIRPFEYLKKEKLI